MGPVSYNSVKNKSLKSLPMYLHCCAPVDFQLLLLSLTYFSFTHQVKKPHKYKEKLANYSSKCTLQNKLVEKKKSVKFGISSIVCNKKKIIHLFSPNQGNMAFTARMLFGAVFVSGCSHRAS